MSPAHGGRGLEVGKESNVEMKSGPRVVLHLGNKVDVIFSAGQHPNSRKDRDYFKSVGIVLEEKRNIVVKSNQAHPAPLDPIVAATNNLDSPEISTVDYLSLAHQCLPRPILPA